MERTRPRKSTRTAILTLTILIIALCLYWLLRSQQPEERALEKITIAQAGEFFLYAPLYIAVEAGIFEENGLEVSIISTGGDDKTWAAVMSGSASFGIADPTFVAVSEERGISGRVIASVVNGVPFWGITFDESIKALTNPEDLRNYTVGTFPSPSTAYTLQRKMFVDAGLAPQIRQGAFGTMLVMLRAKQVDIALELEPNVSQAISEGAKIVYSLAEVYGDFAITGLTTTPEILQADSALANKVGCSLQQALDFARSDFESTLEILSKRFPEVSLPIAESALKRVLQEVIIPT